MSENRIKDHMEAESETESEEERILKETGFEAVKMEVLALSIDFLVFSAAYHRMKKSLSKMVKSAIHITDQDKEDIQQSEIMIVDGIADIAKTAQNLKRKIDAMSILLVHHKKVDEFDTIDEFFEYILKRSEDENDV